MTTVPAPKVIYTFICDRCGKPYQVASLDILICPPCLSGVVSNA